MAGVAGGRGHLEDVLVEAAAGLVDGERGEALHLGLGRDHRHPDVGVGLGRAGGDLGDPHGVAVVGEHDHLARTGGEDRVEHLLGAGPTPGTALDDLGARLGEQRRQAGTGGDRDDAPAAAGLGALPVGGGLLGEVGHPHPVGPPGLDPGLEGRPDVVDVDVDVPEPVAADDDEGVAERRERLAQGGDPVVVGVEEVHHLVGRAVGRELVGRGRHRDRPAACGRRAGRRPPAGQHRLGRVEDDAQAAAARVDDAGVTQRPQLLGGAGQRLAGRGRGGGEHVAGPRPGGLGRGERGVGGGAGDGEHRPLDRLPHGGVAGVGRLAQRLGHDPGRALVGRGPDDPAGQRAQHLAEDDPGVAARAEQRAAGHRGQRGPERRRRPPVAHRVAGGGDGEEHVGAGVAVGHREDVEGVDLLAGGAERVGGDVDEAQHRLQREPAAGGCQHVLSRHRARVVPHASLRAAGSVGVGDADLP